MRKNKKGFEIALNFIVMLILALFVFGIGIYYAFKLFGTSNVMKDKSIAQLEDQMESVLCDPREPVCVGVAKKTVERGNYVVYTLRIVNKEGAAAGDDFSILVTGNIYVKNDRPDESTGAVGGEFPGLNKLYDTTTFKLKNNEKKDIPIGISAEKNALGNVMYVYNIKVTRGTEDYPVPGAIQKIYVNVR